MCNRKLIVMVVMLLLACFIKAEAEEKFGISVYGNAKYDESTSKTLAQAMKTDLACYRTSDGITKVIDFYMKQPGMKFIPADSHNAMFKKGKIDITLQDQWMDMKTGKMMSDTLISIVNNK